MVTIRSILMLLALLCFVLAAAGVPSKVGLVPAGLACWTLAGLI